VTSIARAMSAEFEPALGGRPAEVDFCRIDVPSAAGRGGGRDTPTGSSDPAFGLRRRWVALSLTDCVLFGGRLRQGRSAHEGRMTEDPVSHQEGWFTGIAPRGPGYGPRHGLSYRVDMGRWDPAREWAREIR
jgi:hypothetical protein